MTDGTLVGYARVSSAGQSLEVQREQLRAAGCKKVFEETKSGRTASDREALQDALEYVREGDTLAVTRLDRLARSVLDLESIVARLREKGADLRATEQAVDTRTATGTAFYQMLGVFAQFENAIRRERQMEGIAKAKARGVYKGRPATLDRAAILSALESGERPYEVARRLKVARSSVYRVAAEAGISSPQRRDVLNFADG